MYLRRPAVIPPVSILIDAAMDSYVDWREECAAVELAYRGWRDAAPDDRDAAFDQYLSALDREEQAASEYRRWIERAEGAAQG